MPEPSRENSTSRSEAAHPSSPRAGPPSSPQHTAASEVAPTANPPAAQGPTTASLHTGAMQDPPHEHGRRCWWNPSQARWHCEADTPLRSHPKP